MHVSQEFPREQYPAVRRSLPTPDASVACWGRRCRAAAFDAQRAALSTSAAVLAPVVDAAAYATLLFAETAGGRSCCSPRHARQAQSRCREQGVCLPDAAVAGDWVAPRTAPQSPLCNSGRGRTTHTTCGVTSTHCLTNATQGHEKAEPYTSTAVAGQSRALAHTKLEASWLTSSRTARDAR